MRRGWRAGAAVFLGPAVALTGAGVAAAHARVSPAATLYVSVLGSDAGNGCTRTAHPCATITHALAVAAAGDTIRIGAGQYDESGLQATVPVSLVGAGAEWTIVDGLAKAGILTVAPAADVSMSGLTLQDGSTTDHGGAVYNNGTLTATGDRFLDDHATDPGGAIANFGTLSADHDVFESDRSRSNGGAIVDFGSLTSASHDVFGHDSAGDAGGALDIDGAAGPISHDSFTGDTAAVLGGAIDVSFTSVPAITQDTFSGDSVRDSNAFGGAIELGFSTVTTISDDTFANDTAALGLDSGGAIADESASTIGTIADSTFTGNRAAIGGALDVEDQSQVTAMTGTIMSGNTAIDEGPSCYVFMGKLADAGYNLDSDRGHGCRLSTARHDLIGVQAGLRPLGHYGGGTLTAPPEPGSPVVGAGGPAPCPAGTDERGVPRPQPPGGSCGIGAAEYAPGAPQAATPGTGPAAGGTAVTVVGYGFTHARAVDFGQNPARFKLLSGRRLVAIAPPGHGTVPITVTSPDGAAASSATYTYQTTG